MLRRFKADLHVHSCLSPCADLSMSPRNIAAEARRKGIEIIAICDHNSAENVPGVSVAGRACGVVVLPGMEVCTKEEVHVLALFEHDNETFEMQSIVYKSLEGQNDPDAFGLQVIANERDEVVGYQDRLLIGAVSLPIERIVQEIRRLGGMVIASHIDRQVYSVVSQLGFIPSALRFDALELTPLIRTAEARERFASSVNTTFVRNSDAHTLDDLGTNTMEYLLEEPTFGEIRKALLMKDGRAVMEN